MPQLSTLMALKPFCPEVWFWNWFWLDHFIPGVGLGGSDGTGASVARGMIWGFWSIMLGLLTTMDVGCWTTVAVGGAGTGAGVAAWTVTCAAVS